MFAHLLRRPVEPGAVGVGLDVDLLVTGIADTEYTVEHPVVDAGRRRPPQGDAVRTTARSWRRRRRNS